MYGKVMAMYGAYGTIHHTPSNLLINATVYRVHTQYRGTFKQLNNSSPATIPVLVYFPFGSEAAQAFRVYLTPSVNLASTIFQAAKKEDDKEKGRGKSSELMIKRRNCYGLLLHPIEPLYHDPELGHSNDDSYSYSDASLSRLNTIQTLRFFRIPPWWPGMREGILSPFVVFVVTVYPPGIPAENIEQLNARLKVIESVLSVLVLENEQTRAKTVNGE
ncbi:hypothetical protein BDP27DRAFT_1374259 [Rhodocollybia butyracea]|uniref:Uncharacterized protein n=1 Tax=Rhodocollybia butyracea TaxID=206335 RepID=A0A9P5TWP0_9AGAR|nr:hypothetical protein BDP27DRAFT_1374259 [Rhodocollybia butyracea]